jgi:hypothetical protein
MIVSNNERSFVNLTIYSFCGDFFILEILFLNGKREKEEVEYEL